MDSKNILPWAHGGPPLKGDIRTTPEDFIVEEMLGFEASGEGEHVLLALRKRGTNTDWLARRLADFAGVKAMAVSYAGLKDRHALTTQTFSVHLPGQDGPDWSALPYQEVEVLQAQRHHRKLKRGALQGNRFRLIMRKLVGDREQAESCLAAIARHGVPNYFGEQRFGLGGRNVDRALEMFGGRRVDRKKRGFLLSAARSQIFNAVLAARVKADTWNQAMPGEVWCLDGSRSWFPSDADQDSFQQRLNAGDIHPSGPMWGRGELASREALNTLETSIANELAILRDGLESAGMEQDRRALRLVPKEFSWQWLEADVLQVSFELPAGSFATVVLRELLDWHEPSASAPSR